MSADSTWDEIIAVAIDRDLKLKIEIYAEGMFKVSINGMAEADLTEDEARVWLAGHVDNG